MSKTKKIKSIVAILLVIAMALGVYACGNNNTSPSDVPVTSISLAQNSYTLDVGGHVDLVVTVGPENATNRNVSWESSDTSVATVSDTGRVIAVAQGTATITVTSVANTAQSATATITVRQPVALTGINITSDPELPYNNTIYVGEELRLYANPYPANAIIPHGVTWQLATDTTRASLSSDGVLNSTGATTVTIIATARQMLTPISGEITVEIIAPPEPEVGMVLNFTEVAGYIGTVSNAAGDPVAIEDRDITLSMRIDGIPMGHADGLVWASEDENVVEVNAQTGALTFVSSGATTVTGTIGEERGVVNVGVIDITGWMHIETPMANITGVTNNEASRARRYFHRVNVLRTPEDVQNIYVSTGTATATPGLFLLGNDIDMAVTREWNGVQGFAPINPTAANSMVGTLDGQGFALRNLYINRPEIGNVGLFARMNTSARVLMQDYIRNLALIGGSITGGNDTGAFVGNMINANDTNQASGLHNVWAD
ncbi:MAG: Ig-like domain-containing protein, partial [Firmicutes bacterium]|nr:Ig-like domain-containing protein [Bacillota bacterium]